MDSKICSIIKEGAEAPMVLGQRKGFARRNTHPARGPGLPFAEKHIPIDDVVVWRKIPIRGICNLPTFRLIEHVVILLDKGKGGASVPHPSLSSVILSNVAILAILDVLELVVNVQATDRAEKPELPALLDRTAECRLAVQALKAGYIPRTVLVERP
jgi:hypothetical protein